MTEPARSDRVDATSQNGKVDFAFATVPATRGVSTENGAVTIRTANGLITLRATATG